jgi:hypothetical protein
MADSLSVLDHPSQYFQDDENLDSVQREVLLDLQVKNT